MEEDLRSYSDILNNLKNNVTNKRDPRALRLAAVTSAIVEVATTTDGNNNDNVDNNISAAKVYAKAIPALEGTLRTRSGEDIADSLSTQVALLELLEVTVPHVTPPAIISATLPLTSRVLRAMVESVRDAAVAATATATSLTIETSDELGRVNAVLRRTCRVSASVLRRVGTNAKNENIIKQLLTGTILTLFDDRRPKVRKAAHGAAIELLSMENNNCPLVIKQTVTQYAHNQLSSSARQQRGSSSTSRQNEQLNDCLHMLGFLDHAIFYLNYSMLGKDMMELFSKFILESGEDASTARSNFVAVVKVQEATPKVLAVSAILSTITTMLKDFSKTIERKRVLDEFAPRVLASLLQASPSLIFRTGVAEYDLLQRGRTLYGQAVLASCDRVAQSNPDMACKLLPLSIQMVLLLSKPVDEFPDDPSVAEVLMVETTQLFRSRVPPLLESEAVGLDKCFNDSVRAMEKTMELLYRPIWSNSLQALVVLLQLVHARSQLTSLVCQCVRSLLELRNEVPAGSPSQHAVEAAFSSLVQGVGIEACWSWVQWQPPQRSTSGIPIEKAWILSAIKSAALVAHPLPPRLQFFQDDILPVARICDKLAFESPKDKHLHQTRVVELWSLFSCFCVGPSDIDSALPSLTSTLTRALADKRYPQLTAIICSGITTLCTPFEEGLVDNDSLDSGSDLQALSDASVKLLPVLFRIVSVSPPASDTNSKHDSQMDVDQDATRASGQEVESVLPIQSISKAISSLVKFAPKPFLQNLFKKLMHRLLEGIQSGSEDSERTCSLLSLSQALVSSKVLDEETNIAFLYRVLKPLLKDDESGLRVQKRAYKVLAEICEQHHSWVAEPDRLKELTSLLTGTVLTSQVSARHMRLNCVGIIIEGLDESRADRMTVIAKVSAETLLCLKDSNAKTRDAAYQVLMSIASRVGTRETLKTFAAALGAETPHMRSAAVMAFSRLVFEFAWEDEELQEQLPSLLKTVLVLMNEESREVLKSVVGFIRICVSAIPPESLEILLPELVGGLLTYHSAKDRFRGKIKIILKKLVKIFGYDALMPHVPASETRLLTHMRKLDQRQRRKKIANTRDRSDTAGFDDMVGSDEEDSGDGRTLTSKATSFARRTGRSISGKSRGDRSKALQSSIAATKSRRSAAVRLPNEADGEVVDMLGDKVRRQVTFAEDVADDDDSDDGMIEFDDDGRLVVHDDAEADKHADVAVDNSLSQLHKRRRHNPDNGKSGQESVASSKRKAKQKHTRELGAAYKSKKAGGDVKKKNQKYEPYAYVALDGRSYSRKNRRSAVEQMASVVRQGKRKRSRS